VSEKGTTRLELKFVPERIFYFGISTFYRNVLEQGVLVYPETSVFSILVRDLKAL
jgi:hypothetical protein